MDYLAGLFSVSGHNTGLEYMDFAPDTGTHEPTVGATLDSPTIAFARACTGRLLHTCLGKFRSVVLFPVRNEQHRRSDGAQLRDSAHPGQLGVFQRLYLLHSI
jgi:hypothetical protein